jgi:uncharacterized protein YceK
MQRIRAMQCNEITPYAAEFSGISPAPLSGDSPVTARRAGDRPPKIDWQTGRTRPDSGLDPSSRGSTLPPLLDPESGMARRAAAVILAMAGVSLGGCGTFADMMCGPISTDKGPPLYGGVQMDLALFKQSGDELVSQGPGKEDQPTSVAKAVLAGYMLLAVADLPFSAIADTVLLPDTLITRQGWPELMAKRGQQGQAPIPARDFP